MTADELNDLADRLFAAFTVMDLEAVESMTAPGAVIVQNGVTSTWAEAKVWLPALVNVIRQHRYEHVRRVVGDRAIVEEHAVRSTTPAGKQLDLAACVVIRVDDDGKIVSLHEYVDPTPIA